MSYGAWTCESCFWKNTADALRCAQCSDDSPVIDPIAQASKPALTRIQQALALLTAEATACLEGEVPSTRGVQRNERLMKIVRALARQNVLDLQISPEERGEARGMVLQGNICGARDMDEGFEEPFPFERGVLQRYPNPMMPMGVVNAAPYADRDFTTEGILADLQMKAAAGRLADAQARVHQLEELGRLLALKKDLAHHQAGLAVIDARIEALIQKIGAPHEPAAVITLPSPIDPRDRHVVPADDVR